MLQNYMNHTSNDHPQPTSYNNVSSSSLSKQSRKSSDGDQVISNNNNNNNNNNSNNKTTKMTSSTAQQRRGKGTNKNENKTTIVVLEENNSKHNNGNNHNSDDNAYNNNDNDNNDLVDVPIVVGGNHSVILKPLEIMTGNNGTETIGGVIQQPQQQPVRIATVRRQWLGTGPFDRYWFNVDCCGIICALLTYFLHWYGMYVVCFILIPPWMSTTSLVPILQTDYNDINHTDTIAANANAAATISIRSISYVGMMHRIIFTSIAALAVIAHFKAMTTNPGAVPPDAKPIISTTTTTNDDENDDANTESNNNNDNDQQQQQLSLLSSSPSKQQQAAIRRLCRRCKTYKPVRAHHCSICNRCIIKMDHHCPWINNCVGISNHKYFLLFILYTFITCLYSLSLVIIRFTSCVHHIHGRVRRGNRIPRLLTSTISTIIGQASQNQQSFCLDKPSQLMYILGLLIEALLFGMFTSCMMFDQADVIKSKMTHIDRFKGEGVSKSNTDVGVSGVVEVFGIGTLSKSSISKYQQFMSKFRLDWLSPFVTVCYPPSLHDEVMGFCRPCMPRRTSSMMNDHNNYDNNKKSSLNINSPKIGRTIRNVEEIL